MSWAVTLDFHNTIARCDDWFDLEVYDLVPAYFDWLARTSGDRAPAELINRGKARYRELRQTVMETGLELDASESLIQVLKSLDMDVDTCKISRALVEIFRPSLDGAEPMPGIVESVRQLSASSIRLAVVSSAAYHPFLEWTLDKFGIRDSFEAVLTSASTGHYKSSPLIYETTLDVLDVRARRCVHIGDSERFDVLSARSLGIKTVLYRPETCQNTAESAADLQVSTLVGLPARLRDTFGIAIEI